MAKWTILLVVLLASLNQVTGVELNDLNKSQLNQLNISKNHFTFAINGINKKKRFIFFFKQGFHYEPKDDVDFHADRGHMRRETDLLLPLPHSNSDQTTNVCLYSNIKLKVEKCFKNSTDCKYITTNSCLF